MSRFCHICHIVIMLPNTLSLKTQSCFLSFNTWHYYTSEGTLMIKIWYNFHRKYHKNESAREILIPAEMFIVEMCWAKMAELCWFPLLKSMLLQYSIGLINSLPPSGEFCCLLLIFCKQFGPRSGPTESQAWSWPKLSDILILFQKEFFEKVNFERRQQTTKKIMKKYPACRVNICVSEYSYLHWKIILLMQ